MEKNNVYSNAKVIKANDGVEDFQLGTFLNTGEITQNDQMQKVAKLDQKQVSINGDQILAEIKALAGTIAAVQQKVNGLEHIGLAGGKDIDHQVVQAIKDLKHYAAFFEQATFQMETKILRTSISIAKKIISVEIGENSSKIAKETIHNILDKIKTASKVKIHLNPRDFELLKNDLNLEGTHISLVQDANVTAGGVVIASDLGNFDGNIEAKVNSMLESLDSIM
ncbi:FliH/SctL family protein [uncultured Arcobacter sp.]|uniref:FliH/SctL family protein n=1 Tax=uncultured Arcobacter sp. TaxID=165434 RepID=UPI002621DB10|nr:FliH/SctL family protein [uncultured Arcobacter sp.]